MSERRYPDSGQRGKQAVDRGAPELERHTKEVFDRSAAELDASTRSRLTEARFRALEELAPAGSRFDWRWSLAPAGALATIALAAWLVLRPGEPGTEPGLQMAALGDLEILLAEEELEMLSEDLDFYVWLESQPEFGAAAETDDGVG